ncbi:MAG: pyrroline-5-carboxylate reductase [Candidatus Omnitrophica bacterium]|nr:pyrroline-5-carboxylate reductase [Candidatus Omnitrophota bacterium]
MFKLFRKKIGIIGCGNMGSAIAARIKNKYNIFAFDKDKEKTKGLKDITVSDTISCLVKDSDVVILAVKPQDFDGVLNEIKPSITNKLIVSIAAGISTGYIEKVLGGARVIRVMPNIGVKIGQSETCLSRGKNATSKDVSFSLRLFDCLGKTWFISEEMMNAATAISGSGPAHIFYDMEIRGINPGNVKYYRERLKEAAQSVGFDPEMAFMLALSTTASACDLVAQTHLSPAELRKQVTSKGGTTEAALGVLTAGGSWTEAALAAKKRAEELSDTWPR